MEESKNKAYNENTQLLPLSPFASKVYGLPQKSASTSTTVLANDKYQGLLAYATQDRIIKIMSLKGYEFEIYEAH